MKIMKKITTEISLTIAREKNIKVKNGERREGKIDDDVETMNVENLFICCRKH